MERNTKILIGVAAAGVVAYLIFKKPPVKTTSDEELKKMEEEIKNGTNTAPKPAPKPKTNADVLFPEPQNFSWKDYFLGIKPIWMRLW
jgi:hypothetical protein